jgi:hypothetical protein
MIRIKSITIMERALLRLVDTTGLGLVNDHVNARKLPNITSRSAACMYVK